MHVVTCTVAIGGDQNNKLVKRNVTAAELSVLQKLHGEASVTDLKVTGKRRVDQRAERDRLMMIYTSHQPLVNEIWRDNGGKFPLDVRDLSIKTSQLARDENLEGPSAYEPGEDDKDEDDFIEDDVPDERPAVRSVSRGAKDKNLAELGE